MMAWPSLIPVWELIRIRPMLTLGVIAIGVGGLEAENVMLGRPSMMRLPDIIGVKLTGDVQLVLRLPISFWL